MTFFTRLACALALCSLVVPAQAQPKAHPCAADAIKKGEALLRLHAETEADQPGEVERSVKVLPPIKALKGKGHFDVLEVWGHVYKADYRMRFIYAQIPGQCVLMGQEILEASNPY